MSGGYPRAGVFQQAGSFKRCASHDSLTHQSTSAAHLILTSGPPRVSPRFPPKASPRVDGWKFLRRMNSNCVASSQLRQTADRRDELTEKQNALGNDPKTIYDPDLARSTSMRRTLSPRVAPASLVSAVSWSSQGAAVSPRQTMLQNLQPRQTPRQRSEPMLHPPVAVASPRQTLRRSLQSRHTLQQHSHPDLHAPENVNPKAPLYPSRTYRRTGGDSIASPQKVMQCVGNPHLQQQRPLVDALQKYGRPVVPSGLSAFIGPKVGCAGPGREAMTTRSGQPEARLARESRPPTSGVRPGRVGGRVRATATEIEHASGKENVYPSTEQEESLEFSEPSTDLEDLLGYLDGLWKRGLRITQATYCVNAWKLYGFIPLKHHGFIMYARSKSYGKPRQHAGTDVYFTLDFGTQGIMWDTFDSYPDVPEGTLFAETYQIDIDPLDLRDYCKATQPFAWPENDCKNWSKGLLRLMGVPCEPYVDEGTLDKLSRGDAPVRDLVSCAGAGSSVKSAPSAPRYVSCMF
eukprot:TRINITY_DN1035_c0_g2_i1.p1 TRINITY_DN1035_c0_g2~~TRINITY_DN1035_c0_g2_i1.p1  ORF type:complete len:519 (-),score=38.22 TRINITY_DN1035_c0_g2_i1:20-1576(-)